MNQISNPNEKKDEKLEFLKREEIRTMQKDIARLREIEAQKERERIAALKIEEKTKKEKETVPEAAKEEIRKGELETLIPKLPPKPSSFQKILVRAVVIMALFLVIGFF